MSREWNALQQEVIDGVRAELDLAAANGDCETAADYAADVVVRLVRAYDLSQLVTVLAADGGAR